jgi:Uma2 family endonuclease
MSSIDHEVGVPGIATGILPPSRRMTEEEFVAWWDEDTRAEWVDGEVIVMSPATWIHAKLCQFLEGILSGYVQHRMLGEVAGREISVRLDSKRRRLPDVLFIANERLGNLREKHLDGAPNLALEIVSEDSVDRDWRDKYSEYAQAGVQEYWVVDPLYQRVEAYTLADNKQYQAIAPVDGKIASVVVPGFYLRPQWLWQKPLPEVRVVLNELLGELQK